MCVKLVRWNTPLELVWTKKKIGKLSSRNQQTVSCYRYRKGQTEGSYQDGIHISLRNGPGLKKHQTLFFKRQTGRQDDFAKIMCVKKEYIFGVGLKKKKI